MIDLGASVQTAAINTPAKRVARVMDPFGNIIGLASELPDQKGKTVGNQPAYSAMYVAFHRALAAQDEQLEIKGPDIYAHLFLSEELKKSPNNLSYTESAGFKSVSWNNNSCCILSVSPRLLGVSAV